MSQPSSDYRPDIDGLRALAVLAVVWYHAFPTLLHGGFIGVDIFFVISGFLISKHIWEDLAARRFSIKTFYARRVRRIFPALGVVLLSCWAMGWLILTPAEYEQLGKHITGGTGFVSNLIYWKEAGYFDSAADTKPLLHLWSLGIEEQFYIAWPLILAFLWRRPQHAPWVLPSLLGASLCYSVWLVQHDLVADFYSPFTRFWELALGALLAHERVRQWTLSPVQCNALSGLGLGLILVGMVWLNSHAAFPGAWALLPTLGAAGLILAGERAWLNRQVLAHPVMVWVGLISYPLYLWHWPLLSFARIMESTTPSPALRIGLVLAAVGLAWLTFRWLERPLRSRPRSKKMIWTLCLAVFAVAMAGEAVRKLDGIKTRTLSMLNGDPATLVLGADRARLQPECGLTDAQKAPFQYCLRSAPQPNYALLGDSKAEALLYGLVRESPAEMRWTMIGSVAPPVAGVMDKQQDKNRVALQTILASPDIHTVIWVVALRGIFPVDATTGFITAPQVPENVAENYSIAIQQLEQAGKRVWFVIDNPTFPDPRSCISGGATDNALLNQVLRRKENPRCTLRYRDHLAGTQPYRQFIAALQQQNPKLTVYDPTPLLCDTTHDVCRITDAGKFLYSYGDHISDYANSRIAKAMLDALGKRSVILNSKKPNVGAQFIAR